MTDARLSQRLDEVADAEARLLRTLDSLTDVDLRHPSLCEGWTRGHVLAHVALNAHSLVNLFDWARTGHATPQYPGWEERGAEIDRFSTRSVVEHRDALAEASESFTAAARAVPVERWSVEVRGIGGDPQPAETFLFARLREVEIHHVDLDAGYSPGNWPDAFIRQVLEEVPDRLGPRLHAPFTAAARDLGVRVALGEGAPAAEVSGSGASLLAWLLGRSDGSDLDVSGGSLPRVPPWG